MPIDPDVAIGAELPDRTFRWTDSDVLLYHLAMGAGAARGRPPRSATLRYTLDDDAPPGAAALRGGRAGLPRHRPAAARPPRLRHRPGPGRPRQPGDQVTGPLPTSGEATAVTPGSPTSGTRARRPSSGRRAAATSRDRRPALDRPLLDLRARRGRLGRRPRPLRAGRAARPGAGLRRVVHRHAAAGPALPPLRRPQPAARGPGVRRARRLPRRRSCTACARGASCCAP